MEKKLKHLEFLQQVITRMNANSFLVKGWAISLVAAILALEAKAPNSRYLSLITTLIFWLLDAFYLSQERQYRSLYNAVRQKDENDINFDMNATVYNSGRNKWLKSFFSFTLCIFYITILFLIAIFFILFKSGVVKILASVFVYGSRWSI
jgi:hypothetical protein